MEMEFIAGVSSLQWLILQQRLCMNTFSQNNVNVGSCIARLS